MTAPIAEVVTGIATAYRTKIDRASNGVMWLSYWDGNSTTTDSMRFAYSADEGSTWSAPSNGASSYFGFSGTAAATTPLSSFFIDQDDYAHVAYVDRNDRNIYYRRGTPNAGRTGWTCRAPTTVYTYVSATTTYPDVVAHREGTGWKAHVVHTQSTGVAAGLTHRVIDITSSGVITAGTESALSFDGVTAYYYRYPSIDFHHTGDGKTVAGGTPHLYLGWSNYNNYEGTYSPRIFFRKATYSGGAWTWGDARVIDNTRFANGTSSWLRCLFDGTRVVLAAFTDVQDLVVYERDVEDTTTTTNILIDNAPTSERLYYGGVAHDGNGNLHFAGVNQDETSSLRDLVTRVWTREGNSLGPEVVVDPAVGGTAYVNMARVAMGGITPFAYTYGAAPPYTLTYGNVDVWTYLPETLSSTPSGSFDVESLPKGEYELGVRTKDALNWSPWSSSVTFSPSLSVDAADTVGLTDAVTAVNTPQIQRAPADNMGITDSRSFAIARARSQADSLGLTDSLTFVKATTITQPDSLGLTDSLAFVIAYGRTLAENLGLTDQRASVESFARAQADNLGLTDTVTRLLSRTITDAASITDSGTSKSISGATQSSLDLRDATDSVKESSTVDWQLSATGTGVSSGTASITATGSLVATGTGASPGTAAITARMPLSATGTSAAPGTAAITARTFLASTGVGASPGSVTITATGSLVASGTSAMSGTAALIAATSLAASGTSTSPGTATLTATTSLVATGTSASPGSAAITARLALAATGVSASPGSAVITATGGSTVASGVSISSGTATLTASTSLVASGTSASLGSAAITAGMPFAASGTSASLGSAAFTATGALVATGISVSSGTATVTASTSLVASGTSAMPGSAAITATVPLATSGTSTSSGTATVTASTSLVASGGSISSGTATIGYTTLVTATGVTTSSGSAAILRAAALSATGVTPAGGSAALTATGALAATGTTPSSGSAALRALTAITATGASASSGSATITARHTMTALGTSPSPGVAALGMFHSISAEGLSESAGQAALTALLELVATGTSPGAGGASIVIVGNANLSLLIDGAWVSVEALGVGDTGTLVGVTIL